MYTITFSTKISVIFPRVYLCVTYDSYNKKDRQFTYILNSGCAFVALGI